MKDVANKGLVYGFYVMIQPVYQRTNMCHGPYTLECANNRVRESPMTSYRTHEEEVFKMDRYGENVLKFNTHSRKFDFYRKATIDDIALAKESTRHSTRFLYGHDECEFVYNQSS